ncbi:MAG: hypothetical protein KAH24_08865, partial [Holophagae bacterium]|nr:hypothetical protein [Holophagae bacterium]
VYLSMSLIALSEWAFCVGVGGRGENQGIYNSFASPITARKAIPCFPSSHYPPPTIHGPKGHPSPFVV